MSRIPTWLIVVGFIVALMVFGKIYGPTTSPAEERRGGARYACKTFSAQLAKDPSSVEFDRNDTFTFSEKPNGVMVVTFGMRANNSFGALMHGLYACTIKLTDGNWTLVSVNQIN